MPIMFVAFIDGLARMRASSRPAVRSGARIAPGAAIAVSLCVTFLGPQPLERLLHPASWQVPERVKTAGALLKMIPDGADVAAANRIAPHLTRRCRVFRFLSEPTSQLRPEWVAIIDLPSRSADSSYERTLIASLPGMGYEVAGQAAGITIYQLRR
jgi:hypothetical protein